MGIAILLAGAIGGAGGVGLARAQYEKPALGVDATRQGRIDFYVDGGRGATMRISELEQGGASRLVGSVVLDGGGRGVIRDGARWRCDRLSRRFEVTGQLAGAPVRATHGARTPSCRDRLKVGLPRRARPGSKQRIIIRDQWGIGDLRLRLCQIEAGDRRRCSDIRIRRDRARIETGFRLHQVGLARIVLTGPGIRISRSVAVGRPTLRPRRKGRRLRILAAGDSMMAGVDSFVADRLASRARIFRDVNPGSGISKPGFDWVSTPARTRNACAPTRRSSSSEETRGTRSGPRQAS